MVNNGTILLVDDDLYLNNANQCNFYCWDYTVMTATLPIPTILRGFD